MEADKVAETQFGMDQIEELARDPTLDAFMAVGPLDSKMTSDAIAATVRSRGEPKFLAIEASEAIGLKHPRYESEEVPPSVFSANPAWPDGKVETISVNHLIMAQKALSETTVAAFFRQLFAVRQAIARQVPGAAAHHQAGHRERRRTAGPSRSGSSHRRHRTHFPRQIWRLLLVCASALSGIGSAGAWLRHYLNRDERDENTGHRSRILAMVSRVRTAESNQKLLAMQREVDAIISETLECYDDGAIEEEELSAFGLVLELFNHAIVERRVALQAGHARAGSRRGGRPQPHVSTMI